MKVERTLRPTGWAKKCPRCDATGAAYSLTYADDEVWVVWRRADGEGVNRWRDCVDVDEFLDPEYGCGFDPWDDSRPGPLVMFCVAQGHDPSSQDAEAWRLLTRDYAERQKREGW